MVSFFLIVLVATWQQRVTTAFAPISSRLFSSSPIIILGRPSFHNNANPRLFYRKNETAIASSFDIVKEQRDRFARTASQQAVSDQPCVLTIDGVRYNMTDWGESK